MRLAFAAADRAGALYSLENHLANVQLLCMTREYNNCSDLELYIKRINDSHSIV